MYRRSNLKVWRRILACAAFSLAAGWSIGLYAQPEAAAAKESAQPSPAPSYLDDPTVKHCRLLAARRTDPKLNSIETEIDEAAMRFQVQPVFDAVASCRAALAAYPAEPKVIIAEYNASEALLSLALGISFPDSQQQDFALTLQAATEGGGSSGIKSQMLGFFLGSAYEYGIGTTPDRAAAMRWYAFAAAAGDPISKRELAKLQSGK